jgi:hypothetical protein
MPRLWRCCCDYCLLVISLAGGLQALAPAVADDVAGASASPALADLGVRWELFVDDWLIAARKDAALKLHAPERREVVLVTDEPWEGNSSAYFSVVQDGELVRLYYRGSSEGSDLSEDQVTCVVESRDGVRFSRPKLGLIEAAGKKENNVVWKGIESHNFAPFLDRNPACKPDERYKALAGLSHPGKNWQEEATPAGLFAFVSADGLHWRKTRKEPVLTKGAFDSLNLAFWDPTRARYACYSRIFTNNVRAIQSAHSSDFLSWSEAVPNQYAAGVPLEHFYTNATLPCPGAEHLLVSFPKRFLPERKRVASHPESGVSDAMFMSSRDGLNWDRTFLEAWVRPGHDEKNWTERSNMPAWGIAETAAGEWSMYISEHYRWPDNRIRRLVLPRHRLASMNAGARGGEFTTRPLTFEGGRLVLNYATSAAGSMQVELQDEAGRPLPGFALADSVPLFGDELGAIVRWKSTGDVSSLRGKPVRLRFVLKDADLFALRFAPDASKSLPIDP